jgi:hypothetical protein
LGACRPATHGAARVVDELKRLEIDCRRFALLGIALFVIRNFLAVIQAVQTGALDGRNMNEYISAAMSPTISIALRARASRIKRRATFMSSWQD